MTTVAVMDYGMGNLRSVANAVRKVAPGANVIVSRNAEEILSADRIIFPGVGAMRDCMAEILTAGFDEVVKEASKTKPMLAICVGMQALLKHSEENGGVDCLGQLDGMVKKFPAPAAGDALQALKVPHMGWNTVQQNPHPLWNGIADNSHFYFVHSYYTAPEDENLLAGRAEYGVQFAAALAHSNVFATQFHPEKSHTNGLQLLKNFVNWNGEC